MVKKSNQKRVRAGGVPHAFYAIEQDNGHRPRELVKIDGVRMAWTRRDIILFHLLEFIMIIKKGKKSLESLRIQYNTILEMPESAE